MMLSGEQMSAVSAGAVDKLDWDYVDRPPLPLTVPEWAKGAAIDWVDGYSNAPRYHVLVTDAARNFNGIAWKKNGSVYTLESDDGRIKQYGHDGHVFKDKIRRWRRFSDGNLSQYAGESEIGKFNSKTGQFENPLGEFIEIEMRCTTKQNGFGGSEIEIMLDDGEPLVLRGPWHIGSPEGCTEITTNDYGKKPDAWQQRRRMKWWQRGGTFGFFLRNETLLNIFGQFQPHIEFAWVRRSRRGDQVLEAIRPEYGMPKTIKSEIDWREKAAAREKEKLAVKGVST